MPRMLNLMRVLAGIFLVMGIAIVVGIEGDAALLPA